MDAGLQKPLRQRALCAVGVALIAAALGLSACGGLADSAIVAHVDDRTISKATVGHWSALINRGGGFNFGELRGKAHGTARRRALALLISSDWLIGEAAREGIPVSERHVEEALVARENKRPRLREHARETGQTVADIKLELSAELAAEALRAKLASRARDAPPREVTRFYRDHRELFSRPAVRVTDLIEGQPTAAAAAATVRRLGRGRRFAEQGIREHVTRTPNFMFTRDKTRVVNAIFAARPGVLSRPLQLNKSWAVFVVRKAIPARPVKSLAEARAEILARLQASREGAIVREFDRVYTHRWRAATSCLPGYVAPGCRQSARTLQAYEDPFSAGAPLLPGRI